MEGASKECGAWSEDAVRILIDSYTAKFVELQRSNLRQKDWQDILARLSSSCGEGYSYARCRNKLDALKKKFKIIKSKKEDVGGGSKRAGAAIAKWKWYDHMEKLMDRSSGGGGARGIPGGIASGEKMRSLAAADDASDDDGELSAANSGDDEQGDEGGGEEEEEGAPEEDEGMPPPSSFLFDLRPSGAGFLDSGLNLTLNGICAAAAAATAAAGSAGSAGLGEFRSPPGLPKVSDKTIRKPHRTSPLNRQATEVVAMVIQAVERIEKNRLEFEEKKLELMRDIDLKRNETNLEIAKCIIESCMSKSYSF